MIRKIVALAGGPLLALAVFAATRGADLPAPASLTAAVTALCAFWWTTEALPLPATSLLPFALLPLFGVLDHEQVAHAYGHHLILLLLGGFLLSKAVERSGAHRRLALGMVALFGHHGRRGLVLGFMVATAISSMWISNSATVLMMLPVALAVLATDDRNDLAAPLLLGIAYAGSIGGIGTPIGTPPNMTFMAIYETATDGQTVSFLDWMIWGVPIVVVMIPVAWFLLTRNMDRGAALAVPDPGPWQRSERRVLTVFGLTAAAWILRDLPIGPGGAGLASSLGLGAIGDETIALTAVVALFLVPDGKGERLLDWETAATVPWGILLLFAGGLAIAMAFQASGLSGVLGEALAGFATLPPLLLVLGLCVGVTFLTEVTSNTATTALLMPILAAAAIPAGLDPRLLMVPAAMSASCAFMLPVATAPNAIIFGTGRVPIARMVREGLWLNLAGALVITAACSLLVG